MDDEDTLPVQVDRPLTSWAAIIMILSAVIFLLSGLCSLIFSGFGAEVFLYGAIGMVPFGLLFYAMRRHLNIGPNLTSEIMAGGLGLLGVLLILPPLILWPWVWFSYKSRRIG